MFLISEPKPAKLVDYFNVELDGNVFASDPQVDGDQKRLHHDLSGIDDGGHTVRVQAVNDWGEDVWSGPSNSLPPYLEQFLALACQRTKRQPF